MRSAITLRYRGLSGMCLTRLIKPWRLLIIYAVPCQHRPILCTKARVSLVPDGVAVKTWKRLSCSPRFSKRTPGEPRPARSGSSCCLSWGLLRARKRLHVNLKSSGETASSLAAQIIKPDIRHSPSRPPADSPLATSLIRTIRRP